TNMEQILTANKNAVDAVLSENDGMAGGVIAALTAQGLAGKVPVSGQDGDKAALNRVALGTQTVDVWKDARLLGKTAGEAATHLCGNAAVSKVKTKPLLQTAGGERRRQQRQEHGDLQDPGREQRQRDPSDAEPDHDGQPQGCPRRGLGD